MRPVRFGEDGRAAPKGEMGLQITHHAFERMADHDILPGEADAAVADPDWCGTRPDGRKVFARGDLAVVVQHKMIITAYRLGKGENGAPRQCLYPIGDSSPQ